MLSEDGGAGEGFKVYGCTSDSRPTVGMEGGWGFGSKGWRGGMGVTPPFLAPSAILVIFKGGGELADVEGCRGEGEAESTSHQSRRHDGGDRSPRPYPPQAAQAGRVPELQALRR